MGVEPASVGVCVLVCSHFETLINLRKKLADNNQILSEATLGSGKGCIRLLARSDQNSDFHGNI